MSKTRQLSDAAGSKLRKLKRKAAMGFLVFFWLAVLCLVMAAGVIKCLVDFGVFAAIFSVFLIVLFWIVVLF